MRVELGDYILEVDAERTRLTYSEIEKGGAERCACSYCRNFLAALPKALPQEVLDFFSKAGIDPRKDAEVYEYCEISPGIRSYGGEYYFWGSIVAEPEREQSLAANFKFLITQPSPLAQEQFKKEGALCFNFNTEVPWVL